MSESNGALRAKKPQLSETIEKLDEMVTDLSVAIPGAVADSVREALGPAFAQAVKDAVKQAVADAMKDLSRAAPPHPTAAPAPLQWKSGPGAWARVKLALVRLRRWAVRVAAPAIAHVAFGWAVAKMVGSATVRSRVATLVTAATGTTAGVGGYLLGPVGAAVLLGLVAATLAASVAFVAPVVGLVTALRDDAI